MESSTFPDRIKLRLKMKKMIDRQKKHFMSNSEKETQIINIQEAKESFASPDYLFYGKSHIVKQLYRKNGHGQCPICQV